MADPFTIRIFVPDGDPEGIRIVDRMNWTGLGVAFPRSKLAEVNRRQELQRAGVYVLVGYGGDEDLPTVYIGQTDSVGNRLESHSLNKDFWDRAIAFVSSSGGLNRAHITWLEHELIKRASAAGRCVLENGTSPQEPTLTEAERADTAGFLREILQILPLLGVQVFELPKAVAKPHTRAPLADAKSLTSQLDTVVVPAQEDGFREVFLGQHCWHAIRISGGKLDKLKYIAAYQSQPVSAITHYAPIDRIEPYGDEGKYRLVFSEPAKPIGPIPFADAPSGTMQGPRYTSSARLLTAKKIMDLFPERA